MPEPRYLVAAVVVSAAVTWALRAIPFGLLGPLRGSRIVAYLGVSMPIGVMVILAVYTVRRVPFARAPFGAATLLALAVTVGLHLWRRNMVLSIVVGTAVNVALTSLVFTG